MIHNEIYLKTELKEGKETEKKISNKKKKTFSHNSNQETKNDWKEMGR